MILIVPVLVSRTEKSHYHWKVSQTTVYLSLDRDINMKMTCGFTGITGPELLACKSLIAYNCMLSIYTGL